MVIGLTGQTGAGKSTVSYILNQKEGIKVIDCDKLARTVVVNGSECLVKLAIEFSPLIIDEDGSLNRKKLAEIVFSDHEKLNKMNDIMFPYIIDEIKNQVEQYKNEGVKAIVIDAPTLFESGCDKFCDLIVVVVADETIRFARILERDNITPEMATTRMNSQFTQEFFMKHADYIIDNSGDKQDLAKSIISLVSKLNI